LGQGKSRERKRTNRKYIRGVNVVSCVPEASWDHISLKQLFEELLYNNITPLYEQLFWWNRVTFNRMERHYVITGQQESISMLIFLQDGLGMEEGQRWIGCGEKDSILIAITR
jgi:hypothetical protein